MDNTQTQPSNFQSIKMITGGGRMFALISPIEPWANYSDSEVADGENDAENVGGGGLGGVSGETVVGGLCQTTSMYIVSPHDTQWIKTLCLSEQK